MRGLSSYEVRWNPGFADHHEHHGQRAFPRADPDGITRTPASVPPTKASEPEPEPIHQEEHRPREGIPAS